MGRISDFYEKSTYMLDNNIEWQNCEVKYLLENEQTGELYLLASDNNETAREFRLRNGKFDYDNVPEWEYNYFENGFDIVDMSYDTHYSLWNSIKELYPEDIDYKEGVKYYINYCKGHLINKKTIDENTKLDTPDIMPMFKEKKKDEQER